MTYLTNLGLAALLALAVPASTAAAQTDQNSGPKSAPSRDAGDQFKSGAQDLGKGFDRIGEGFKQGAIQAWEAVKSGAETAGDKLNGRPAAAPKPAHTGAAPNEEPPSH